jgi:hypothetical protein
MTDPVDSVPDLHGALLPVVRQIVQNMAGIMLGAGVVNESMASAIAGLILSGITVVWMLAARAKALNARVP